MSDHATLARATDACEAILRHVVEMTGHMDPATATWNARTDYAAKAANTIRRLEVACEGVPESLALQAIRCAVAQLLDFDIGAEHDSDEFSKVLRASRYAEGERP